MANEEKIRPYVEWYVATLTVAAQAINEGADAGKLIRGSVDELSESQVRNVLTVVISRQAQQAVEQGKREGS